LIGVKYLEIDAMKGNELLEMPVRAFTTQFAGELTLLK
jgi:hypothetical protein